jgi:serralysin
VPGARDAIAAGDGAVAFERPGAQTGDRIDLSAIDANTTAANDQAFAFGTATGKGRLWVANVGNQTVVRGNTDNDAAAEFELAIEDVRVTANQYTAADFIL